MDTMVRNVAFIIIFIGILVLSAAVLLLCNDRKRHSEPAEPCNRNCPVDRGRSLSQKQINVISNDEIGRLAVIFNKMLAGLGELVQERRNDRKRDHRFRCS